LKHGIRHLVAEGRFTSKYGIELESSLNSAFSPFQLEAALNHAETVEQVLNTPDDRAFARWLESAFVNFKSQDDDKTSALLDAVRKLYEAGTLLVTTNYDSLLSDLIGAPAVTWEQHADFHRVMTRQKPGILHIHGHWRRPSSIVLGSSSYHRVISDVDIQQLFRTLWLEWSWLYIGCGDGLDDPNFGRLLEWSKGWGTSALPDFVFAREDKAKEIAARPCKPSNLVSIGYMSHDELPVVLGSVTPAARCWPFVRIDDDFPLFHVSGANDPFPTKQEYIEGNVPTLAADAELLQRLQAHGWACCIDMASVGKTTLALRTATTHEQEGSQVFYLDLKKEFPDGADASPLAAAYRLARPNTLLILDNIHHQPELARHLWQQFNAWPSNSRGRLLLVATRIHQPVVGSPEQDLTFFERHPVNPAVLVQPSPSDLGRLAKHLYQRVGGPTYPPMPEPPADALSDWHPVYRAALNAFTFAVLGSLAEFQMGRWSLPASRASAWVRKYWLEKLDPSELQNTICLAAFGAQQLEMLVSNQALPYPDKVEKLFQLGLVALTQRGKLKQYGYLELREPGWGQLILAAHTPPVDEEQILFATVVRHLQTAVVLSARLRRDRTTHRLKRLWAYLADRADQCVPQVLNMPFSYFINLVRFAEAGAQPTLIERFWKELEHNPDRLIAVAWQTPLDHLAVFLEHARAHPAITNAIWESLENEPQRLASCVLETQLHLLAYFLDKAQTYPAIIKTIWETLENEPEKLAALVWETPLEWLPSFLAKTTYHPIAENAVVKTLEEQPHKLVASVWETPLDWIAEFLHRMKEYPVITKTILDALENDEQKTADLVGLTELAGISTFLERVQPHPVSTLVWQTLTKEPKKLASRALETQLHSLGSFVDRMQGHPVITETIWEALENDSQKTAALVWTTELMDVATFLDKAKEHPIVTNAIWEALENQPEELAVLIWETSLGQLFVFVRKAMEHPLVVETILEELRRQPDRLEQKGAEATLNDLVAFAHYGPIDLLEIALRGISPGHWDGIPADEGIAGATWLVWNSGKIDRNDLATDLATLLLRRANWRDFSPKGGGFAQACWLLANAPSTSSELVEFFCKAVCTQKWLQVSYEATSCGQLASGLRQLALHQSVERCRQFHHKGLGGRLSKECARFETATPSEQSQIIQLLGSAGLCGWVVSQRSLANITVKSASELPLSILPHRHDVTRIEDHQLQLWLGLRNFVSIRRERIPLPLDVIEETLQFWRTNLIETSATPTSAAYRVNQSMITWLENCCRAIPVALLPSTEPLWTLIGFPVKLVLPLPQPQKAPSSP
jgi:hypothetical protein